MNTYLDFHTPLESPARGRQVKVTAGRRGKASVDAAGSAGGLEEPSPVAGSLLPNICASLPQGTLKPSENATKKAMECCRSPSENIEDIEGNPKPVVAESLPSKTSNQTSSLSQKSLMARFFEYLSSQDIKKSLHSAEQDQVVDGWLNMNQNQMARKSKYKNKLLKVLHNRASRERIKEPLINDDGDPRTLSFQNIRYNSDDGLQKADIQRRYF